jgi:hypothetical protein
MVDLKEPQTTLAQAPTQQLYRLYMEAVFYGTVLGVVFPMLCLAIWSEEIGLSSAVMAASFGIVVLFATASQVVHGQIFRNVTAARITIILYAWGMIMIMLSVAVVAVTGGVCSSVFRWLFGYALVVSYLVCPVHEDSFFRRWRPVLLTSIACMLALVALGFLANTTGRVPPSVSRALSTWSALSIAVSLGATFATLVLGARLRERRDRIMPIRRNQ